MNSEQAKKKGLLYIHIYYTSKKLNALEWEELNATDFEKSVWCYFTNANRGF